MGVHLTREEFERIPQALREGAKISAPVSLPLPGVRARGRVRHETGEMNATERAYSEHLDARKAAGEVAWYGFEVIKVRLAKGCWYIIDFMVLLTDGALEAHDVKATTKDGKTLAEDDAMVKIKVAAALLPWPFKIMARHKGRWFEREF